MRNNTLTYFLTTGQKASLIYLWALENDHGSKMDRLITARFLATADPDGSLTMNREDIRRLVPRGDWAIQPIVDSLEHSGLVERLGRTSWRLRPPLLEPMKEWMQQECAIWAEKGLALPELPVVPVLTPRMGTEVEQSELEEQSGLFDADYEAAWNFEQGDAATRSSEAGVERWQQVALFNASLPVTTDATHEILAAVAATFDPELGMATITEEDLEAVTGLGVDEVRALLIEINKQGIWDAYREGVTWEVSLKALGAATVHNFLRGED